MEKPASIVGIQRILVPTDFSPTSQRALDYATRLAESTGAVMILMHAWNCRTRGASVRLRLTSIPS